MGIFRKPAQNAFETSMSIELDDADLLDIDGSDDLTAHFANRTEKRRAAKRRQAPAAVRANVKVHADLHPTTVRPVNFYPEPPTLLATQLLPREAKKAAKPQAQAPWQPRVATESGVSESYPPVAVMTEAMAELKLGGSTKSPWGWVGAAVIGTLLLIGASLRAAPQFDAATANAASLPPPAAVEVASPKPVADDAKVVKFDDAIAITRPAPKPAPAAAPHHWWKRAPKVEKPVAEKAEKPAAPAPAPANAKSAEQKELEDLQLKAAAR